MPVVKRRKKKAQKRLLLPRARVLVALAVVGLLGWGMHQVWQSVAPSVIHRDRYLLAAERIRISPSPEWILADVRREVVHNANLDRRLSVLDQNFVDIVADAFVLHPWVASVDRITKRLPPGVEVELAYRRPVAVVELAGNRGIELLPIDDTAVHLPGEEVPKLLLRELPRVGGIVGRPPVGQPWADPRVAGSAKLAALFGQPWQKLHLVDILPSTRPEIRNDQRCFVFDLITHGGTRIVWGAAPGNEPTGEDSVEQKLARLRRCLREYGPLDSPKGPDVVEVRSKYAITPRTVKKTAPRTVKKDPPTDETKPVVK